LLRLDAVAYGALARFLLARRARRRLPAALAGLHHDALRPQSRARGPQGDLSAGSQGINSLAVIPGRATARTPKRNCALVFDAYASARNDVKCHCSADAIRAFFTSVASQTIRLPRSRPRSSIGSWLSMWPNCPLYTL